MFEMFRRGLKTCSCQQSDLHVGPAIPDAVYLCLGLSVEVLAFVNVFIALEPTPERREAGL